MRSDSNRMVWATPSYLREEVNDAGRAIQRGAVDLFSEDTRLEDFLHYEKCLSIVNNWRSSHSYPLNTFQATLRLRAKKVSRYSFFATRIKRLESIDRKLRKHSDMKLSQMQDIGGLRAILPSCENVYSLVDIYDTMKLTHEQAKCNDYISKPKTDGYRSVHLIYRYRGKIRQYDDLKLEIQLRSDLQHAWATAVETVGTFTKQALKSSEGDQNWLRFFALASSVIAERENAPGIPGVPEDTTQRDAELSELSGKLNVRNLLQTYQSTVRELERHSSKDAKFFLLSLEPEQGRLSARGFLTRDSMAANQQYTQLEQEIAKKPGAQAVLVKVDSVSALRRAYPNYFADTTRFMQALNAFLP